MVLPYVPDCAVAVLGDGTLQVTHSDSGRVRTARTARQALIVGTELSIAHTWHRAADSPCKNGHIGPFVTDPANGNKRCRACGATTMGG